MNHRIETAPVRTERFPWHVGSGTLVRAGRIIAGWLGTFMQVSALPLRVKGRWANGGTACVEFPRLLQQLRRVS
jgi:hypothetical protein